MSDKKQNVEQEAAALEAEAAKVLADSNTMQSTADDNQASKNAAETKKVKTAGLWFFGIINFLLILVLIAGAYWAWLQWQNAQQSQRDTQTQERALSSQVLSLEAQIKQISKDAQADQQNVQTSIANLVDEVVASRTLSDQMQSQLSEVSGRRPADWLLAEADYLVRMAGRKLWLENDVRTAMMMLKSADTRLEDLADPSLFPVRKLIAQDIQTLHNVNPVSTSSIALALSGMIPQVDKLTIAAIKLPDDADNTQDEQVTSDIGDWRSNIAKTWRAIVDDFISVTRTEQAVQPYLADKQQWLIKEQVKHALTQAQSAALSDNDTLFKASLQQATAMIVEYYDLSTPQVDQFMGAVQQLMSTSITRDYPRSLASQAALSAVIEQRVENVFTNKATGEL